MQNDAKHAEGAGKRRFFAIGRFAALFAFLAVGLGVRADEGQTTAEPRTDAPVEKFVPHTDGAQVELRTSAQITGAQIKLKQILKWSDADKGAMDPLGDLVVATLKDKEAFASVTLGEVKMLLHDAGVNLGQIKFTGATNCTVSRADVNFNEGAALEAWIAAKQAGQDRTAVDNTADAAGKDGAVSPTSRPAQLSASPGGDADGKVEKPVIRTLRDILTEELASRVALPVGVLQVRFKAEDEKRLRLVEPLFQFSVDSKRIHNLGEVTWDVTIISGDSREHLWINATARAWQNQLVAVKPLAAGQLIREEDVIEKRALVEQLSDTPLAQRAGAVGQQAAYEISPGTVVQARMIESAPMVHRGELIDIVVEAGNIRIKTVAEARENGAYGQTIRVRKSSGNEEFNVVVTGPQQARMSVPSGDRAADKTADVR